MSIKDPAQESVNVRVDDHDDANDRGLKQRRSQIGKLFRDPISDDGLAWGLTNVATWIRQRTSSSSSNPFDDDDDDDDKVKEAVHGVFSWIRKHAIAIAVMILSLTATILVFIFDPNNQIRTTQAIGLWIWTALPGMVIMVFLASTIVERIILGLISTLASKQPNWILVVVQIELRSYMRLILFTFALNEFILDWFNFYTGSPDAVQRIETLLRDGLLSVYTVALLLIVRNILLNLLEFSVTKQSFRKEIQAMVLQIDTLQRLFCRSRSEQEELEQIWNQNQDRKQFMYRVNTIRDHSIRLLVEQRQDENCMRLGFSKVDMVEIQTVKDMSQLVGFLFDDIATSSIDDQPCITLPDWRQFFIDMKQSRRAFMSLFRSNPDVMSSRVVHRDGFIAAWQKVFKSRSALANQLKAAKNVYKLVESVAGALFWVIMLFVIARNFGFDVGQVVTAASAFVISFAFATSKSLSRVVESIMFVFVSHPFQVNDSVKIAGKWFVVESIGILETRVRDSTNLVTRYSNAVLADLDISNVVYSGQHHIVCIVTIQIAIDTRVDQLEQLRLALVQYTMQNQQSWKPGRVTLNQNGVTPSSKIELEVRVESCMEWADLQAYKALDFALKSFLFGTLMSLNLNWDMCTQPIMLLESKSKIVDPASAS